MTTTIHSETYVFGKNVAPVEMLQGITRKTLTYTDRFMVCEVHLAKGAYLPPHHHIHEQSSNIISGSLSYEVGAETRIVGPGDSVLLLPNVPHAVKALEDSVVLDIFTPLRKEYI